MYPECDVASSRDFCNIGRGAYVWDVYQTTATYHIYLEYAGMVYDGMTALNQPIPLVEYQSHFAPVFRQAVASASTLEETLAAVNGLVWAAKYQR